MIEKALQVCIDHMRSHWNQIKFSPSSFVLESDIDDNDDVIFDVPINKNDNFTPIRQKQENKTSSSFTGVIVRNFPLDMSEQDIKSFLVSKGMPEQHVRDACQKMEW